MHFYFASAFKLPNSMRSLCLRDPLDHELPSFKAEIEAVDSRISIPIKRRLMPLKRPSTENRLFALETGNGIGWVLALGISVYEDLDPFGRPPPPPRLALRLGAALCLAQLGSAAS